jgi:hypothetical protein
MASTRTNWGKTATDSVFFRGETHEGAAAPATFYLILINNGYNFASVDPDDKLIADIGVVNCIDPADYSGNSVARAAGSFTMNENNTSDRSETTFTTPPVISAGNNLTNIKGFAVCTEDNLLGTNRVFSITEFTNAAFNISSGQTITITGSTAFLS